MEVRIWESSAVVGKNYEETQLVKKVDIEMYKDMDFGGFIVIEDKTYKHSMYNMENNILFVKPVELNRDGEEIDYSEEFICPYCNHVDSEAWELSDEGGEVECSSCGSEMEYERIITVEYNIKPKKCASITIIKCISRSLNDIEER